MAGHGRRAVAVAVPDAAGVHDRPRGAAHPAVRRGDGRARRSVRAVARANAAATRSATATGVLLRAINWNRPASRAGPTPTASTSPTSKRCSSRWRRRFRRSSCAGDGRPTRSAQDDDGVTLTVARTGDESQQEHAARRLADRGRRCEQRGPRTARHRERRRGFRGRLARRRLRAAGRSASGRRSSPSTATPAQPATAVNSGPGRRRFEFMRRADVTVEELNRPETAWRLMEPWGVTPDNARLERHAVYTFRGRWATEWRRGRVFLAGDCRAPDAAVPRAGPVRRSARRALADAGGSSMVASGRADAVGARLLRHRARRPRARDHRRGRSRSAR